VTRGERLMVAVMIASCVAVPIEGALVVWALLRPGLHLPALGPALAAGWAVAVVCLYLFGAGRRTK
jgi:hypothetical protein